MSSEEKRSSEQTALVLTEKGQASLQKNFPVPSPGEGQVLLKAVAAGLNPVDWKILLYNWTGAPLPHSLGSDVSGVIVELGKNVKDFKVGDEVFTTLNLFGVYGSFAEYAVADACRLAHKGSKLTHIQAASLPIAFLSAWDGFTKTAFEYKQTMYVPGGAGGVGHFIIQLAKIYGLTVFSSGGKEESLNVLKDLGVDHIFNYTKDNVVEEILKATDGKGVDFVWDATYVASSFENSAKVLKEGGTFIILGNKSDDSAVFKAVTGKKGQFVWADLVPYSRGKVTAETQRARIVTGLNDARRFIEEGSLRPLIKTIGWSELLSTLQDMQKGKTQNGKVVLDVSKQ